MNISTPEVVVILGLAGLAALWWRIFQRAGYSRWLGLVMLIPFANVVMFIWFAVAEWPIQKQLKKLKTTM